MEPLQGPISGPEFRRRQRLAQQYAGWSVANVEPNLERQARKQSGLSARQWRKIRKAQLRKVRAGQQVNRAFQTPTSRIIRP